MTAAISKFLQTLPIAKSTTPLTARPDFGQCWLVKLPCKPQDGSNGNSRARLRNEKDGIGGGAGVVESAWPQRLKINSFVDFFLQLV